MFGRAIAQCVYAVIVVSLSAPAYASCSSQLADKKLSGAAKTSFMTKCTHDAETSCAKAAQDKKLYGAARTSFEKKCVSEAVGAAKNPS